MSAPIARIADLAEQVRGVSYAKEDASAAPKPGYLPVLRAGNITDEGLMFDDLVYVPAGRISRKQRVRRHDVLIAASSGSLDVVGKAARALADFEGGFGAFCKVLRPAHNVDPAYFAHFFKTQDYRRRISALASGININNLRNEHLDEMRIPLPPLPEQQRIAKVLDRAEALLDKRRAALAQLDPVIQSIFLDMFGDPATNPKHFDKRRVGDLTLRITNGYVGPTRNIYHDTGVPYLLARHVKANRLMFDGKTFVSEAFNRKNAKSILNAGDVLLVQSGHVGESAVVPPEHEGHNCHAMIVIKPKSDVLTGQFLSHAFETRALRGAFKGIQTGMTLAHLNCRDVRELSIPLPPLHLQCEFARRVGAVERLKAAQRVSLVDLGALFATLQSRAFRGEL